VESIRENAKLEKIMYNEKEYEYINWKEYMKFEDKEIKVLSNYNDSYSSPSLVNYRNIYYMSFWPSEEFLYQFIGDLFSKIDNFYYWKTLVDNVRIRENFGLYFVFNYNNFVIDTPLIDDIENINFIIGDTKTLPFSVTVYKKK
jgi:hypothetical protein